jgi:preprotein translocase subunit YajC
MGEQQEMYTYIVAGIAIIVVLYFAMRLRRSIARDKARQARRERFRPGPALAGNRYRVRGKGQ